jgi:hypothetical protein
LELSEAIRIVEEQNRDLMILKEKDSEIVNKKNT